MYDRALRKSKDSRGRNSEIAARLRALIMPRDPLKLCRVSSGENRDSRCARVFACRDAFVRLKRVRDKSGSY